MKKILLVSLLCLGAAAQKVDWNLDVKNKPFIDIRSLGAKGDGIKNNTSIISSAIATACAAGGGTIFFPTGTWLTDTQTVCPYLVLRGNGSDASIIKSLSGNHIFTYTAASFLSRVTIEDLALRGNSGTGDAIHFVPTGAGIFSYLIYINKVSIYSAGGHGIYMPNAFNIHISNVYVDNCGDNLIELGGGPGTTLTHVEGGTVAVGKNFIRVYAGNPSFTGVNGINGGGAWGLFGQDPAAGDGALNYSFPNFVGVNIESSIGYGVRFRTGSCGNFYSSSIVSGPVAGAISGILMEAVAIHPCILDGSTKFQTQGAGTWANGVPIHAHSIPFVIVGANLPTQGQMTYYDDTSAITYNIPNIEGYSSPEFGVNAISTSKLMIKNMGTGAAAGTSKLYLQSSATQGAAPLLEAKDNAGNIFFKLDPANLQTIFTGNATRTNSLVDNLGRLCINISTCLGDIHVLHNNVGTTGPLIRLENNGSTGSDAAAIRFFDGIERSSTVYSMDGGGNGVWVWQASTANVMNPVVTLSGNAGSDSMYIKNLGATGVTRLTIDAAAAQGSSQDLFRVRDINGVNLFRIRPSGSPIILTTGTQDGCTSATRFQLWTVPGAGGVKDTVQVCAKDAADLYAWRTIY